MEPQFNKFVTFKLSPEEQVTGESFHPLQAAVIQNRRAEVALNILNLEYDPLNPQKIGLDAAMLDGQMKILDWMLEISAKHSEKIGTTQPEEPSQGN